MASDMPTDPPLVDVKVTNPVIYIKRWWKKVIGNEGMSFTLKVKPLTTIAIFAILGSLYFGVAKLVLPEGLDIPFIKISGIEVSSPAPKNEAETWKETAYIGTLKFSESTKKFFLITPSASEAITLEVPENINLSKLIEKRIMVIGQYSKSLRVIQVMDAKDMEILPNSPVPIPTTTPSPKPTESPTETPNIEPNPEITPYIVP